MRSKKYYIYKSSNSNLIQKHKISNGDSILIIRTKPKGQKKYCFQLKTENIYTEIICKEKRIRKGRNYLCIIINVARVLSRTPQRSQGFFDSRVREGEGERGKAVTFEPELIQYFKTITTIGLLGPVVRNVWRKQRGNCLVFLQAGFESQLEPSLQFIRIFRNVFVGERETSIQPPIINAKYSLTL